MFNVFQKEKNDTLNIGRFKKFEGYLDEGLPIGLFGIQEKTKYLPENKILFSHDYPAPIIPKDEEYFEWMDIIESILTFDKTYQFVEVGAGYGSWAARAFRLASLFCIPQENISICTVEADPLHSQWLLEHMVPNKIPLENIHHFECAVSNFIGKSDFFIMRPNTKEHASEARNWYGQALKNSEWENASSIEVTVSKLLNIFIFSSARNYRFN